MPKKIKHGWAPVPDYAASWPSAFLLSNRTQTIHGAPCTSHYTTQNQPNLTISASTLHFCILYHSSNQSSLHLHIHQRALSILAENGLQKMNKHYTNSIEPNSLFLSTIISVQAIHTHVTYVHMLHVTYVYISTTCTTTTKQQQQQQLSWIHHRRATAALSSATKPAAQQPAATF